MAISTSTSSFESPRPQRILVIGGGPTGLVTLRNLIERGDFERVELVERRDDVGGVWYLDNPSPASSDIRPRWPSPAYPGLIGNVLPKFLSFSAHPFPLPPSPKQPFPTLTETHAYLRSFAEPHLASGAIRLNSEVVRVEELQDGRGWRVVVRDWSEEGKGRDVEEMWDAVVGAMGWYDHPAWPLTEGLEELKEKGIARHAKWWRGPQGYEGKRVLVVGNANSSNDMAAQLTSVASTPVYQSIRRMAFPGFPSLPDERIAMVAPVAKYVLKSTPAGNKFDAHLTDGRLIEDLDFVQLGTGYKVFPDFIRVFNPSVPKTEQRHIPLISEKTQPNRIPSLHRHVLYAHNPSLAFIGAPMAYTPFTIADVASTWLALAWQGLTPYPATSEGLLEFERARLAAIDKWRGEMANPSSLMVYTVLGDSEEGYARELREDVVAARPELDGVLPVWSAESTRAREAMFPLKLESLLWAREQKEQREREVATTQE